MATQITIAVRSQLTSAGQTMVTNHSVRTQQLKMNDITKSSLSLNTAAFYLCEDKTDGGKAHKHGSKILLAGYDKIQGFY